MIKDTFFSNTRFLNLCRKEMVENWKTNILRFIMLYGVMAISFTISGFDHYSDTYTSASDPVVITALHFFMAYVAIFGCLNASTAFDNLKTKTNRLSVLMNPSTAFEKFFSRWLIYTVVYIVLFVVAYVLADYTRILICKLRYPDATMVHANIKYLMNIGNPAYHIMADKAYFLYSVIGYFFFQSFFLLGSTVWPRNSFIKTIAAAVGIMMSYGLVATGVMKLLWNETSIFITNNPFDVSVETARNIFLSIVVFFTLFNWTLSYFRFKETEIIERM
ncbi:hypothetical protein LJC29_03925 [Bacteroides sp. OttesenSCG-928-N06]|nr:hypothetical protein [Bacteroides sp. OttesenSCG-928-N06]